MGYRSDVRIITSKKGYDKLRKHVEKYLKERNDDSNLLEDADVRFVTSKGVLIGWDSIKWYEWSNWPEIDSILSGLQELEKEDYSYRFGRLGEGMDDIDERYYDSEHREGEDIPYIDIEREFNDEYMKDGLLEDRKSNKEQDVGAEI